MVLDLLLLGLVVAIEPIPLSFLVLLIASEHGLIKGLWFLIGWVGCLVGVMVVAVLISGGKPIGHTHHQASQLASWLKIGAGLALSPLCCTICERDWVPSLTCPRGQCVPIDHLAGQQMQRWSEYVRKIVAVEHHLGRDHSTGQFIANSQHGYATASVRPHVLTMMNRLFDSPPPMPASVTTQCVDVRGQTPPPRSANNTTSASPCIRFDRGHWPHFASDFIRYEHMVLAAHDQLFETHGREFSRVRQHRLLLDGLLAPTNSIPCGTAAAVGWAVSWLGPSQELAPPTGFTAPALGLTS